MISLLQGTVFQLDPLIVVCGGVGYGVQCTHIDLSKISVNQQTLLYIHETIKEDSHDLYGFIDMDSKKLFEQLLTVKNVGPKSALAVLDIGSESDVRRAIASGEVKLIQTAKGIGKRAAEQIVVELRDKVGAPVGDAAEGLVSRGSISQDDEAFRALLSLGYSELDAQRSLDGVSHNLSVEERVRQALKIKSSETLTGN